MAQKYTTISKDGISYLCSCINQLASVSEAINNTNLADDKVFSNLYTKKLIDECLEDANTEAKKLVGALTRLTCEATTVQPTLDNSSINVIYLYSATGNAPYQQYLKINETELIDMGSTTISLTNYLTATQIASVYAKQVDLDALTTSFNDLVTSVEKKIDKDKIVTVLDDTVTDDEVPSARLVYEELDKKFEGDNFVKKDDITNTIDINSSDIKIPNVKAIYNDIIEGKFIDQTVTDTYGTEILKYPLGIWRINDDDLAHKFSDLPVKLSGRIEITSIEANTNKNPWNTNWAYRAYNFEPYKGMNYFRKVASEGTAGVLKYDTGWQSVGGTTVNDVPKTTLTPLFPNGVAVASGGVAIHYIVRNGWCNVDFVFNISSAITFSWTEIAWGLPKPLNNVNTLLMNDGGKISRTIPIKINSNGSVSSRIPTEISTSDWWASNVSYPVAE